MLMEFAGERIAMSVQFGRWNFDGKPVDREYLEKVKPSIAPHGPDDAGSYSKNNISILYHAFHTTRESRRETQPHVTASGAILTWDGRLDNRADLIRQLGGLVTAASTDVEIVAAAYEYWGSDCFAMLIGDWALSLWDPHTRSLILAKDPIGTRHLYYSFDSQQVTWSTILHRRLVLVLSRRAPDALHRHPFRSAVVFGAVPPGKAHRSQVLGFRSRQAYPLPHRW